MNNANKYLIAYVTLSRKEILRFSRIWLQTIVPPVITTTLYFLIFGNLMGERIGDMQGVQYIDFIMPGLVMMAIITNAYSNVVSSFFSAKFSRHIEELLVSPVPNTIILLGYLTGGICRGLSVGFAVVLVSALFTDLQLQHLSVIILVAFLTAMLFSLAGLINGIFARSFDDVSIVPTFVLTPLIYLGGIFYSINLLPQVWQNISLANPILYMINSFRYGFLGVSDIGLTPALLVIIVFIVVLFMLALWLLHRGTGIRN